MKDRGKRARKEEQPSSAGDASPPLTRNRAARSGVTLSVNEGGDINRSSPDPLLRPPIRSPGEDSSKREDVFDASGHWRTRTPETKYESQSYSEIYTTLSHTPENKLKLKDVQISRDQHRTPKDDYVEDDETGKDDAEDSEREEENKMTQKQKDKEKEKLSVEVEDEIVNENQTGGRKISQSAAKGVSKASYIKTWQDEEDEIVKENQTGARKISQSVVKGVSKASNIKTWQDPTALSGTSMGHRHLNRLNHVQVQFGNPKRQFEMGDHLFSDDEGETTPAKSRKNQSVGEASKDSNGHLCIGWSKLMMLFPLLLLLLSAVWWRAFDFQSQIKMSKARTALQSFKTRMDELKPLYPNQEESLWARSSKILGKHLNSSHHTEPVILLLTATPKGEVALRCLGERIARNYAGSLNATVVSIDGTSKTIVQSDVAKLEVDEELSTKFSAGSKAGVIHRIEQLPAGSVLIFYKYCDHENAAFKDVALVLTVLLEDEVLTPEMSLKEVEETVKDFIWDKFSSFGHPTTYKDMDGDKLGGLWSRISHAVLPVKPEEALNGDSC